MAIAINRNTTQSPMAGGGKSGSQVVKFIPAPRVYMKAADTPLSAVPVQKYYTASNGSTPTGWTDLGIVQGMAKVTYTKKTAEVRTGMDESLRAAYVDNKAAQIEFNLSQFDDVNLELLTGYTGSIITSGSVINYQIGEEDVVQKALLLVVQNKLDKKEIQFYNPAAYVNFNIDEVDNGLMFKVTADLPAFTPQGETAESFMSTTIFAI